MAFSNVGLGVVHGMAHPLGAIFDIPHGVANACLLLPIIMEFNAPAALDKYVEIAKAMNVYSTDMTERKGGRSSSRSCKNIIFEGQYTATLVGLGVFRKVILTVWPQQRLLMYVRRAIHGK